MTSLLDNLECSSDSDDIHRLFPKCRRPNNNNNNRADINLNTLHDANDNMLISSAQQQQQGELTQPPSPAPSPAVAEILMDSNVNGLSVERRGADADDELDEEDEEEDDDEERDESASPAAVEENGTFASRKYNKHLRDSRIEIAGGREVFSQSKSKAARKRYSDIDGLGAVAAAAAAVGTVGSLAGPRRVEDSSKVWEVRARGEQLKKVRNVPAAVTPVEPPASTDMVTETVFSTEVRSIRRDRFRVAASSTAAAAPVVYEVPMTAEVVVFDDIGECLAEQHLRGGRRAVQVTPGAADDDSVSGGSSSTGRDSPPSFHRPPADFFKVLGGPSGSDADTDALSPERSRAPRVIGGLPIAEYEGSPRRYGPRPPESSSSNLVLPSAQSLLSSPSVFPPRPGFPQRVQQAPPQDEPRPPQTPPPPVAPATDPGAYDYLYEFSETRKVLEEFFKPSSPQQQQQPPQSENFHELDYNLHRQAGNSYVGQRLAKDGASPGAEARSEEPSSPPRQQQQHKAGGTPDLISLRDHEDTSPAHQVVSVTVTSHEFAEQDTTSMHDAAAAVEEDLAETEVGLQVGHSRNFTLSPETTDCDSNDIESEVSLENEGSMHSSGGGRLYGSMPVLEDGLSSGHASDAEDTLPVTQTSAAPPVTDANPTVLLMKKQICEIEREIRSRAHKHEAKSAAASSTPAQPTLDFRAVEDFLRGHDVSSFSAAAADLDALGAHQGTPPPPAPQPHRSESADVATVPPETVEAAIKDIRMALQRTKALPLRSPPAPDTPATDEDCSSPVWVPRYEPRHSPPNGRASPPLARRHQPPPPPQPPPIQQQSVRVTTPAAELERKSLPGPSSDDAADEEELDTDLETDRLLGQQRTDDQGFFDDKEWRRPKLRGVLPAAGGGKSSNSGAAVPRHPQPPPPSLSSAASQTPIVAATPASPTGDAANSSDKSPSPQKNTPSSAANKNKKDKDGTKKKGRNKEVLIEGVLFRARYLGSTQLVCEGQPTKSTRMMQAEEAVSRIKALAPEGENQPSTEVDLFISTEKIMVLNTDLKEIMMDHALRTISYIADIGDLVVLMARRRYVPQDVEEAPKINRTPKMICHVFESDEAQFIAQSIGQAFQVAYMEFLKANGIEDHSFVKEMDYQEVLNSQEIFGDELQMFAKKEMQKEVVVPKAKGEILGVVIVESGWGSMLPTVVIANLAPAGAAARCGQLNIGDQIIAINGVSLVGLPLSTCQNYIKNSKNQTVVKLTVVPCAPVVEVKIKRPDTKYQLGFSVQNGVICSLLRGGIAERGGVRVGHRIIEINNQSVVAVPHEKIVNLLATSVGEILMKTMPTSMFRLLTGQETPVYI